MSLCAFICGTEQVNETKRYSLFRTCRIQHTKPSLNFPSQPDLALQAKALQPTIVQFSSVQFSFSSFSSLLIKVLC